MPFNNSSIDIGGQQNFIQRHGEWLNYSTGMKCTCMNMMDGSNLPDANRADPTCEACKGLGWLWEPQDQILGMVSNITQQKDLIESGLVSPGDLVCSPQLDITLMDYDKIQIPWSEGIPQEGQLIQRSDTNVDETFYPIMKVNDLITVDKSTGMVTHYTEGTDFTFDKEHPSNQITWTGSNIPGWGLVFSIKYEALVDWIVFTLPQPRKERGTNLGQRVMMRKKHVVFNGV